MQAELTRLQRQVGITFVYVTHDQEEALAMSDRIAVMDRGRLQQVGTPAEIYDRPAGRGVMEFIGSANVFEGRIASTGSHVEVAGAAPGVEVAVEIDGVGRLRGVDQAKLPAGARAAMLVRPERIRVTSKPIDGDNVVAGTLEKVAHLGFVTHCSVRLPSGHLVLAFRLHDVEGGGAESHAEGDPVFLSWRASDARVFAADAAEPLVSGRRAGAPSTRERRT